MPHRHSQNSLWQRKRRLFQMAQDELREILDKAFRDTEKSETVSLSESVLLDIDHGEVLRTPTYTRTFDFFSRR
jgi:hypothetical protein